MDILYWISFGFEIQVTSTSFDSVAVALKAGITASFKVEPTFRPSIKSVQPAWLPKGREKRSIVHHPTLCSKGKYQIFLNTANITWNI